MVLDGYWWDEGPEALRRHVHGLAHGWAAAFPHDEVTVVARRPVGNKPIDVLAGAGLNNLTIVRYGLWPHPVSNVVVLPLVARRRRADIVLAQNFCPPWGRSRQVFIHDLMFESDPGWFTRVERVYFGWMTRMARRARGIFTSTETEASRIRRYVADATTFAVGQGVEDFATGKSTPVPGLAPSRYLMTLGRLNARKNLGLALEGARLSGALSPEFPLVIVGRPDGLGGTLPDWADDAAAAGCLRFLGLVHDEQLRWLLQHAAALLYPSRDEGFGLPPLEARTAGTPVIASSVPVLHETLGEEATFVDPDDPQSMASAIQAVLENGGSKQSDVTTRFTWCGTATAIRQRFQAAADHTR